MDFAFALFRYFPYGGLQRDMMAIAAETRARGHHVTIYTREWQGENNGDMEVVLLPAGGLSNHARDRRFARLLEHHAGKHDRLVGFNKMPGLDFYYAADGCLAARYAGQLKALLPRYRSRLAMESAVFSPDVPTRILSISPPQKQLYRQHYHTPAERFIDLPPGIRRDRVVPEGYQEKRRRHRLALELDDGQPLFLFVGSGFRTKGLDRAIRAFAQQPDQRAVFFVVGADDEGPCRRLARKLGVEKRLYFVGGQDNIPEWLRAADLLLHPAHAENTGTVLLEAAVAGLPVITTDACGYAPYIEQAEMGTVLPADDFSIEAMVRAIHGVLERPRQEWVQRGRRFAADADIFSLVAHAVDAITGEAGA